MYVIHEVEFFLLMYLILLDSVVFNSFQDTKLK